MTFVLNTDGSIGVGPDPYTNEDRASALPDDYNHPVVSPKTTWQGPGVRCGQLVVAPTTSIYGIRPCLSVTTVVDGVRRHFNYDGFNYSAGRKVGR